LQSPEVLPTDTMVYLLGSRYCETDKLSDFAWSRFAGRSDGWATVSDICNYVHETLRFNYKLARSTRTAVEALEERVGVCRDFTHAAITLCRCLNIPARYCTGYLGDIGVPPDPAAMDFSAWFEAYIDGSWWTFDPRHNKPRIGRIVIARGRDAADVPFVMSFGQHDLSVFEVTTEEASVEDAIEMERRLLRGARQVA
jgi:transglutaminase-like putative cysteine protease